MKIILAKSAGFCWGVSRAVDKAMELADAGDGPIYTDGPLIHNEQLMARLRSEGILETDNPGDASKGTLLIRAHGISPERRSALIRHAACLVDATCPDVAKIQGKIRKHARTGYDIIIYGDEGHAEVIGLLGYAEDKGHVVNGRDDVEQLRQLDKVCLVSQSTQFPAAYSGIAELVKMRFPDAVVLDTICIATKRRQAELLEIAGQADVIVVVGGAHSANTVRLVELAKTKKPTIHIQTADDIDAGMLKDFRVAGLSAGASTPAFIIDEVMARLEKI